MSLRSLVPAAALILVSGLALAQSAEDRREWPKTDFARRTVDLAEIESGGPPKDGIPAIDRPRFVGARAARTWLKAREPVIVLRIGREARAYPIQILMFHEIVNDTVGGVPVAVTFCPLCNASMVFDRRVAGRVLDFGTTGRLRFSDLVMYDRQSESWWQQFTGRGIVGHYAGTELRRLPSEIVAFEDFAAAYPAGLVLSRETGHARPYGRNPYAGYDRIDQSPFLFSSTVDKRLAPMERVLSVSVAGKHRLYPLTLLEKHPVANRELGGLPYVVFVKRGMASPLDRPEIEQGRPIPAATAFDRRLKGRTLEFAARDGRYYDMATGTEWNLLGEAVAGPLKSERLAPLESGVHFAFAWLAFNPESEIVRALATAPESASAVEHQIEGRVLETKVTLCQLKPRGCAGYFTLDSGRGQFTVQVRLGVPIRAGEDYLLLANLPGRTVSVRHVVENGEVVARSIEVLGTR